MKTRIIIKDGFELLTKTDKQNNSLVTLKVGEQEIYLTTVKGTNEYFWVDSRQYENYLVIYSRGSMLNQIPLKVEAAYDLKNKRVINVTSKNKKILEYMCITKESIHISVVLEILNDNKLEIAEQEDIDSFIKYLTIGSSEATIDEIKAYIISKYPILDKYINLKRPLTVKEYRKIKAEMGNRYFAFHIMPNFFKEEWLI